MNAPRPQDPNDSNDTAPRSDFRSKGGGKTDGRARVNPILDAGRSLPSSHEAERAVLSCMIQTPDVCIPTAIEKLQPDQFHLDAHRILFRLICETYDKTKPVDLVSLQQILTDRNQLDLVGGFATLAELYNMSVSPAHIEYYAAVVDDKSALRSMITACSECINSCFEEPEEIPKLMDTIETHIMQVRQDRDEKKGTMDVKRHVMDSIERMQMLFKNKDTLLGLPSGYSDLDKLTSGLHAGDMFIIAARPSMGKTSFVMNIIEHVCVDLGHPALVFSLEMSSEQLVGRLMCSRARVNMRTMGQNGSMSKLEFKNITKAGSEISKSKLFIDDTAGISIIDLRSKARRLHKEHGIKVIAIDYLQLMKSNSKRAQDNRQFEIAEISAGIKALAKELKIPILVLAQLNRNPEQRTSGKSGKVGKPRVSDLRESGSIEQDADIIGMLYRAEYYVDKDDKEAMQQNSGKAELLIGKHRNGATGSIPLTFIKELMRFETRAFEEGDGVEE